MASVEDESGAKNTSLNALTDMRKHNQLSTIFLNSKRFVNCYVMYCVHFVRLTKSAGLVIYHGFVFGLDSSAKLTRTLLHVLCVRSGPNFIELLKQKILLEQKIHCFVKSDYQLQLHSIVYAK